MFKLFVYVVLAILVVSTISACSSNANCQANADAMGQGGTLTSDTEMQILNTNFPGNSIGSVLQSCLKRGWQPDPNHIPLMTQQNCLERYYSIGLNGGWSVDPQSGYSNVSQYVQSNPNDHFGTFVLECYNKGFLPH